MESGDLPPTALTYADQQTDAERGFYSLDRAMAARLARAVGVSLIGFGGLIGLVLCAGLDSQNSSMDNLVPLISVGIFCLPGLILATSSGAIDRGGKISRIVVLITSLVVFAMLSFGVAGSLWQILHARSPDAEYVQLIAFILLLAGTANLLYHDVRLILYSELQGETPDAIVGIGDRVTFRWLRANSPRRQAIRFLGATRIITGAVILAVGGYCIVRSISWHQPVPPKPVVAFHPVAPQDAFTRDLYRWPAASCVIAGLLSAVLGATILRRSYSYDWTIWPVSLPLSMLVTAITFASGFWLASSLNSHEPLFHQKAGNVVGILLLIGWLGFIIVCDMILPILLAKSPPAVPDLILLD